MCWPKIIPLNFLKSEMIENCLIWNCQIYSIKTIDRVLPGSSIIMHCGIRWMCLVRQKAYEADSLKVSYAHGRSIFTIRCLLLSCDRPFLWVIIPRCLLCLKVCVYTLYWRVHEVRNTYSMYQESDPWDTGLLLTSGTCLCSSYQ